MRGNEETSVFKPDVCQWNMSREGRLWESVESDLILVIFGAVAREQADIRTVAVKTLLEELSKV